MFLNSVQYVVYRNTKNTIINWNNCTISPKKNYSNFESPRKVLNVDERRVVEDDPVLVPVVVVRPRGALADEAGQEELAAALNVQVGTVVDVGARICQKTNSKIEVKFNSKISKSNSKKYLNSTFTIFSYLWGLGVKAYRYFHNESSFRYKQLPPLYHSFSLFLSLSLSFSLFLSLSLHHIFMYLTLTFYSSS